MYVPLFAMFLTSIGANGMCLKRWQIEIKMKYAKINSAIIPDKHLKSLIMINSFCEHCRL